LKHTNSTFNERGHLNDLGVSLYVDALKLKRMGGLPENLVRHVEECQECRREITGLYELVLGEDYSTVHTHPTLGSATAAGRKGWQVTYRLAAAIVALLGVAVAAYYLTLRPSDHPEQAGRVIDAPAESTKSPADIRGRTPDATPVAIAENFAENPELEYLLSDRTRSASVSDVLPRDGASVKSPIHMRWRTNARGPFHVVVMNNKGNTVASVRGGDSSCTIRRGLAAGLYYWKLEGKGNLLHVGKFKIER
jgi:hypothetical protein